MCLETVGVWLRSWVVQAKARFRYRIDKAHAARARKRWIKRQKSVIRANYQQDCHSDPLDHLGHHPYKPTTYVSDSEDEECRLTYNSDQVILFCLVAALSPTECLGERSKYLNYLLIRCTKRKVYNGMIYIVFFFFSFLYSEYI